MNEISHGKARALILKAADSLLVEKEATLLSAHLEGCEVCRDYQKEMEGLHTAIRSSLRRRVTYHANRAAKPMRTKQSIHLTQRLRRNIRMKNAQKFSLALVGTVLALVALAFGSVYLGQRMIPTPAINETAVPVPTQKILPTQPTVGEQQVTITFAADTAMKSIYEPLMETFHKEHTNITVQFVELDPSKQVDAKTKASLADVSLLSGRSDIVARAGYFRDLTPLMETDSTFQVNDFWPNALTGCQDQEGRSYGIPLSLYMMGILYDPTALDAAALPHPQAGWTWDEFRQLVSSIPSSQALSRRYSFVDLPVYKDSQSSVITYLLAPVIGGYLEQQNGVVDPASFPPTVQWYLDLVQQKHIFPVTEADKSDTYQALFQDGSPVLMIGATNSWIGNDFALSKYNMMPFPIQNSDQGNATTPIIATCGVISAGSNHPQEAWLWLNYISHQWIHGDERLVYVNQAVPARRSVVNNNPYWETIPANAQEAYRFGLEHGWYGSAYPEHLWALTQAIIETTSRGTSLANTMQSQLANLPKENSPSKPSDPIVIATPRPQNADTIKIRFYTDQVFQDAEKYQRIIEGFHREHPEIDVELSSVGNPADFPGNGDDRFYFPAEKYDCFEMDLPNLNTKDLSAIRDVNTWLDQDATLRADFFPGQIDAYSVDGRVYGLPASTSPNLMFYNKTLLNRLGITLPKNDWTFDEFIQMATAASTTLDGQKIYGFAPYANRDVGFLLAGRGIEWIHMGGAFPQARLNDSSVVDAYRWIDGLRQSGVLLPTTFMDGSEVIQNTLAAGQLAFWTAESTPWGGWYFNSMEKIPYEIGAVPLPNTTALNTANNPGMTGLFISGKSQNAQACWTWIQYLSEQPDALSGVPARKSVAASSAWETKAGIEKALIYRAALEQINSGLRPASWEDNVLTSMFSFSGQAIKDVFAGTEAGVALSTAQRKADFVPQCLEQANYLNLPSKERESIVYSCLQQADAVR